MLARRSNKSATRFGAIVSGGHPRGSLQAYKLDASATGGAVDVLANFNLGTTANAVTSYRRLLPGLTLEANPARLRSGEQTTVRFTVLDAGDPVPGARVKVAGRSGVSDGNGRVTLGVRATKAVKARATRGDYTAASTSLVVRGRS